MKKIHILFLVDFVPSPRAGNAGGQMFAYYIQELRKRGHQVSFIALARPHEQRFRDDLTGEVTYCQTVPVSPSPASCVRRAVRRLIEPAEYALISSSDYSQVLLRVLKQYPPDIIHAVHPWLIRVAAYTAKRLFTIDYPIIVGHVMDIISAYRFQEIYQSLLIGKLIKSISFSRSAYFEFLNYSLADYLIVHSQRDLEIVNLFLPNHKLVTVSPVWFDSINSIYKNRIKTSENNILFVGNFNDQRSIEGLMWLVQKVLPILIKKEVNLKLSIASINNDKLLFFLNSIPHIRCYGYKDTPEFLELYDASDVFVFPLQRGRYSRHIKVLNAFARGIPVVMTSWANFGAEAVPGEEALIADTPEAFAECIGQLLSNPALAARIAEGGLRRIRREYPSPSIVLDSLEEAYRAAITQKEYGRPGASRYTLG